MNDYTKKTLSELAAKITENRLPAMIIFLNCQITRTYQHDTLYDKYLSQCGDDPLKLNILISDGFSGKDKKQPKCNNI